MTELAYANPRPSLALCGIAATGVVLSVTTLIVGLSPLTTVIPLAGTAVALLALRSETIGRSMLGRGHWRLRYGRLHYDLLLRDIRQVTVYPQQAHGDQVFVHLADGCVLPLPPEALPPVAVLTRGLKARGVHVVEAD